MSGIPAGAGQLLGKRLGKFDILALLALGGTAEIYLARIGGTAGFEKYVVVKCLHDHLADDTEFVKMFLDEARLAAHLDHSNIVQTMELGQHEGRYYMVMEFLAGLSLAMVVRRAAERLPTNRIPVPLVLNILAQSCAGLHYAHEKAMNGRALNIVHRDISPQNLVISFEGVVKIVDFGIAKAEMRETHTRSGTIKGKFAYMSPEQCVANNVDRRTDVFALGVIAHELLTGRRLFKRPSPYETYQSVMECVVKPPSTYERDIDPALDPVILRALTKDKAERYPSAEAFGDALLGYLHHRGIGSGPGDVSRFFDAYFAQEIDEHSGRMRELISGREISVDTGVSWGGDEPDDDGQLDLESTGDDTGDEAMGGMAGRDELFRRSPGPMSILLDELGTGSRVEDDDEMPAERTRIEANPLERVNELERLAASAPPRKPSKRASPAQGPSEAVPVPPPPRGSSPRVGPGLPGLPPAGRFSEAANRPTMIEAAELVPGAAHGDLPRAASAFANNPTSVDGPAHGAPPAASAFANHPTDLDQARLPPVGRASSSATTSPDASGAVSALAHGPAPADHAPPGALGGNGAWQQPPLRRPPVSSSGPPIQQAPAPPGYPVMNAQLSAQIATGATVFPSDAPGNPPPPAPPSAASRPTMPDNPGGYPRPPGSGPMPAAPADGKTMLDPQHAANLVSPVGPQYPERNWGAAAAMRARAVPTWGLAALFIAALGIALALTVIVARLIR